MQSLEVSGAVRPLYGSLGVKGLKNNIKIYIKIYFKTAPTCFGVTVTPSSGSALICAH